MEKLLQNAMSEQTFKYLQTQQQLIENSSEQPNLDLRVLANQVQDDLYSVQHESALDYLKVQTEIYQLDEQMTQTDNILENLEGLLTDFQGKLNFIKDDMTNLQKKSQEMNIQLKNRKELSEKLNHFLTCAILEPELIADICNKEIDEEYIESINKLKLKIQYLNENRTEYMESQFIQELEPELQKLNKKACQRQKQQIRVRDFLVEKILLLKTPKTNICVLQNNVLGKYYVLLQFLREIFPIEICNLYAETIGKIYFQNFKIYAQDLVKLIQQKISKSDALISENTSYNQRTFLFTERQLVLNNMDETPIICQVARQQNQKFGLQFRYSIERIYKSLNKFILDSVQGEFHFTMHFFSLRIDQNIAFFGAVLKQTLDQAVETLKYHINQCNDIYSILLITLLNQKSKESNKQINYSSIFDKYFEEISMLLWPRFNILFDNYLINLNIQQFKEIENKNKIQMVHQRIIDFCAGLQRIYQISLQSNKMLQSRISIQYKQSF